MGWIKGLSLVGAAAALLGATPALADPTALFGNTLRLQLADGSIVNFYINSDGSYTEVFPGGALTGGSWTETADQMCYTQQTPDVLPTACDPKITKAVGDSWPIAGPDGQAEQFSIVAGR
ncbi:MAG TPA: hypothetical protein VF459_06770 [Caulobacteraceae bacterium]